MIDFVAIDFETANSSRDSACSLGAVVVKNGKIIERRYSLINPHVEFNRYCTYIHGITEDVVVDSPSFADIYPVVYAMLDGKTVVAHNVGFDKAVLIDSCKNRSLLPPESDYFCSVEMSRKAWPELPRHKLDVMSKHFNLPLKHHNAIEDATACAMLVIICAKEFKCSSIEELKDKLAKKAKQDALERKRADAQLQETLRLAKLELESEEA